MPPSPLRLLAINSLALLFVAFPLIACAADDGAGAAFTVRDSAGIAIAENHQPPADTLRPATPVTRIGLVEGPAEYLFQLISDVQPLSDGRVIIVDNRAARVAMFDADGRWLRDLGGRGDGPGEYRTPLRAWLEGDTLVVLDYVPRRTLRYTLNGMVAGGERVPWKTAPTPVHRLGDIWIDEREWGQGPDPEPAAAALLRIARDGTVIDTMIGPYRIPEIGWQTDERGWGVMVNPPVFSAAPSWTTSQDHVYWTPAGEPRIDVLTSAGRRVRRIHLALSAGPVTDADREAWRAAMHERYNIPLEALAGETFAERQPAATALLADDSGRLWVALHDPSALRGEPGRTWLVVDREGRAQTVIAFPAGFRLLRIAGGRGYGVGIAESGVQVVHVFDLHD